MEVFAFVILLVAVPLVKPNVCPDGSSCPGADTCCSSSSGYRCCPFAGGNCCSDGNYCCQAGYVCIPGLDICILPSSGQRGISEVTKISTKIESTKEHQCPPGTTQCTAEGCCPLPNAVCCSDNEHCCPEGYTCNLAEGTCDANIQYPLKNLKALVKKVKDVNCPDGGQCPDGSTCCMMTTGQYGCCSYSQAVCCPDEIHCCPSGTTCGVSGCNDGNNAIPWQKKMPAIKPNQALHKLF